MTSHTNPKHNNNNIIQLSLSLTLSSLHQRLTSHPNHLTKFLTKQKQNLMQNRHPSRSPGLFCQPPSPRYENEERQIIEGLV